MSPPPHVPIALLDGFLVLALAGFNKAKNYFNICRTLTSGWVQLGKCPAVHELQSFVLQFVLISVEIGYENLALVSSSYDGK